MACWAWIPQEWKDVHGQQLCPKQWVIPEQSQQHTNHGSGGVWEEKAESRRLFLRKPPGSTSTSPVPALHQNYVSQQSLGAAPYQHSSAIQTHLYKQIQIQLPWQRSSWGLGLLKFVFCNYFSLLCFFSRFYAKLHGSSFVQKIWFFWVVPLLGRILNHVIQSPFWLIGSLLTSLCVFNRAKSGLIY